MADAPAYTTVPGRLAPFLTKVRETGVPPKATQEWLASVGFKSKNDRTLIPVLRQIGFIDASSVPTPAWRQYRGGDHRQVLGRALRAGYNDLYATYSDAHTRSNTELADLFSTKTNAGKQSIDKMVSTFKKLADQAEFESPAGTGALPPAIDDSTNELVKNTEPMLSHTHKSGGVTIIVNVQLTLPESADQVFLAAFFSAMRKHLLSDDLS